MKKRCFILFLVLMLCLSACGKKELPKNKPDFFSFSGGTGKVQITCEEFTMDGETAMATVVFSSSSYSQVRIGETVYPAEVKDGKAVFTLPLGLNRNTTIYGTTTKMSTPHEIEYTVYLGYGEGMDSAVPGLTFEKRIDLPDAKYLTLDAYVGNIYHATVLLQDATLQYLIAPADAEIPAGLDQSYTIIRTPVGNIVYAESADLDYRSLIAGQAELVVIPGEFLQDAAVRSDLQEHLDGYGIPMLADLSADESEAWQPLFAILEGN